MRATLLSLAVLTVCAAPAAAQAVRRPPAAGGGEPIAVRAYAAIDGNAAAAVESFNAAFGGREWTGIGGGAEVDAWRSLFVRVSATRGRKNGHRVFVDNGQVYDLKIPMTVTLTPIEIGAGWRFTRQARPRVAPRTPASRTPPRASPPSRYTPFVGGAFISLGYRQASSFIQSGDDVSERYTGAEAFGGVDITIRRHVFVGVEGQYRRIVAPDAALSLMHEFGENDLGGVSARVTIGFSTK